MTPRLLIVVLAAWGCATPIVKQAPASRPSARQLRALSPEQMLDRLRGPEMIVVGTGDGSQATLVPKGVAALAQFAVGCTAPENAKTVLLPAGDASHWTARFAVGVAADMGIPVAEPSATDAIARTLTALGRSPNAPIPDAILFPDGTITVSRDCDPSVQRLTTVPAVVERLTGVSLPRTLPVPVPAIRATPALLTALEAEYRRLRRILSRHYRPILALANAPRLHSVLNHDAVVASQYASQAESAAAHGQWASAYGFMSEAVTAGVPVSVTYAQLMAFRNGKTIDIRAAALALASELESQRQPTAQNSASAAPLSLARLDDRATGLVGTLPTTLKPPAAQNVRLADDHTDAIVAPLHRAIAALVAHHIAQVETTLFGAAGPPPQELHSRLNRGLNVAHSRVFRTDFSATGKPQWMLGSTNFDRSLVAAEIAVRRHAQRVVVLGGAISQATRLHYDLGHSFARGNLPDRVRALKHFWMASLLCEHQARTAIGPFAQTELPAPNIAPAPVR